MKHTFFGYYKDLDISQVINTDNAIIVLDSTVLCNLYGFNPNVWKPILDMLEEKKDLLWLPYNMAYDYHKNIIPRLTQKIQFLTSIKNRLKQSEELLKNIPIEHSIFHKYTIESKNIFQTLIKEIAYLRSKGKKNSELREAIASLYTGRIGVPYNDPDSDSFNIKSYPSVNEADAITGNKSITSNKCPDSSLQNKDDIILHTLINLSNDKNKDIIYVTSEPSQYWSIFIGNTSFGPNPDHQNYFQKNTSGHLLYCCPFAAFMSNLSCALNKELDNEITYNLKKFSYGYSLQNGNNE